MGLSIRHNIEVAHRLYLTEGKCEAIHGHSMWVDLDLLVDQAHTKHGMYVDGEGSALEFGVVKKAFRTYLDTSYDHHLLLNIEDPFAGMMKLAVADVGVDDQYTIPWSAVEYTSLPGLHVVNGDPTTENLARWFAKWAADQFKVSARVIVNETSVNAAYYTAEWEG